MNPLGICCVQITVTNMKGEPVANSTVLLELNGDYLANYTTDKNGIAAFSLDTSNFFDPSLRLAVSKHRLQSNSRINTSWERGFRRNTCKLCETHMSKQQCLRRGTLQPICGFGL